VILRDDEADLLCNECGVIVRTVPTAEAEKELSRMLADRGSTTVTCRHCGAIQTRSGFDTLLAFTCQECGLGNEVNTTVQ
jgi:RNase P subunit RPR2